MNYHAHIYFHTEKEQRELQSLLLSVADLHLFHYVKGFSKPVGPHPLPMIEVQFPKPSLKQIKNWLTKHLSTYSTLIHPDTGDDVRDHTQGVIWIGQPLEIDFHFFEKVKNDPTLVVHPVLTA